MERRRRACIYEQRERTGMMENETPQKTIEGTKGFPKSRPTKTSVRNASLATIPSWTLAACGSLREKEGANSASHCQERSPRPCSQRRGMRGTRDTPNAKASQIQIKKNTLYTLQ